MSPTVLRSGPYRFFFFSREEPRMHVHVGCSDGEAKFWLEPSLNLAYNYNLSRKQISEAQALIEARLEEFVDAWHGHFGG